MSTDQARAARERKQKIFVAVGGIVLLGLLAFQLPKILGGSGSASAAPAAEVTAGGETEPGAQSAQINVALTDTDRPLDVGPGQLRSFGAFRMKDPFVQQVVAPEPSELPSAAPTQPTRPKAPSKQFTPGKTSAAAVTVISVNGVRQALERGARFPSSAPVFVLVSEQPKAKTVVVGIPGGKYANGSRTTKLEIGKPLVFVNAKSDVRYRVVLVKVGGSKAKAPTTKKP
jgi:hypothetical protein